MRRSKRILTAAGFLLLAPLSSYASIVGDPETLGHGRWSLSADADYVFNRNLRASTWEEHQNMISSNVGGRAFLNRSWEVGKPQVKDSYRAGGTFVYGLLADMDVYGKLGTADQRIVSPLNGAGSLYLPTTDTVTGIGAHDGSLEYKTDNGITYGAGLKVAREIGGGWSLGTNLQYSHEKYDYKATRKYFFDIVDLGNQNVASVEDWKGEFSVHQFSVAPYVAKKMGNLTPYAGFVYTYFRMKDRNETAPSLLFANNNDQFSDFQGEYSLKYGTRRPIGLFAGIHYRLDDRWSLSLEGRFLDETAVSLSGNCIF